MVNILEHVVNVLQDSFVASVVDHIDADIQLLPVSHCASKPFPGSGSINERSLGQGNVRASAKSGLVKHLSDVLLSLGGPSGYVRAQACNEVVHDVERAIVLLEAGPLVGQLKGASNWREPLELKDRLSWLITVQQKLECAMRPPWDLPAGFKFDRANQSIGHQEKVNVAAMQGRGVSRV